MVLFIWFEGWNRWYYDNVKSDISLSIPYHWLYGRQTILILAYKVGGVISPSKPLISVTPPIDGQISS